MTEASGPAVRSISDIAGATREVVIPTRDISFDLPPVFGDAVPPAVQHRCSYVDTIPPLEVFSAPGPFAVTLEGKWPALWSGHEGRPVLIQEGTHKKLISGEVASTPPLITAGGARPGTLAIIYDDFINFNYCHWTVDWLPRVHTIQAAGFDLNDLAFLFPWPLPPVARETLMRLGVRHVLELDGRPGSNPGPQVFDRVVVPSSSFRNFRHCFYKGAERLFTQMRASAPLSERPGTTRRKIWIGRKGPGRRVMLTEDADILEELGFEQVFFEDLSFSGQVDAVRSASHIVAVHGAGLANLTFAEPGTKLFEIFSPHFGSACFLEISRLAGIDHACTLGVEIPAPAKARAVAPGNRSFALKGSLIRQWFETCG